MDDDLPAEPLTAYQQHLVHEYLGLAQKLGLEAWRRACISPLPSLPSPEKYEFVGLAYIGALCNGYGVGVSSKVGSSHWMFFAHELGQFEQQTSNGEGRLCT